MCDLIVVLQDEDRKESFTAAAKELAPKSKLSVFSGIPVVIVQDLDNSCVADLKAFDSSAVCLSDISSNI